MSPIRDVGVHGLGGAVVALDRSFDRKQLDGQLLGAYVPDAYVPENWQSCADSDIDQPDGGVAEQRLTIVDCRSELAALTADDADLASRAAARLTGGQVLFLRHWRSRLPPGLPTTGLSTATRKLLGMHVDNQQVECEEPPELCRRLCVNLGQQDRFLLFSPHSVRSIHAFMGLEYQPQTANAAVAKFLGSGRIEIMRVRIPPGFGYICATDEVVHDGIGPGLEWDETVTWFGAINDGGTECDGGTEWAG